MRCIACILGITNITIYKKKEMTGVLNNRHLLSWARKTTIPDDRDITRTVKKSPKTVSEITNKPP